MKGECEMKKYLGILVVLCMLTTLLIPGFALAAENILDNGGLETGDTTGWTTYPPGDFASGNIAISAVEEAAYSGSYGLKLETTANNPGWGKTGAYLTVTASKLDLSKEYVLSCYVKSADGKNRKLQLQATYRDKNTAGLYDYKSDEVTVGAEWQKLSLTMAAGNTVLSSESQAAVDCLEVYVQNAINEENAGTYYADDMEMTEIEDVQTVSNTISVGEHGKVTIAGKDYTGESQIDGLTAGEPLSYTVTPDEGYEIDTITYNGVSLSEGMEPTVTADGTLTVTFRVKAPVLPSVTQNGTAIVSEDYDGTGYTAKTFYFSSVIPTGWTADGYGAYLTDDIASGNMIQLEGRVITNGQFAIRVFGDAVQNTEYFMKGYLTDGTNEYTGDWQSSN